MKFKSAMITQASGSVGGMTASRNRGGMYFRGRAMPVNANTPRQQAVRSALGGAVQSWSNDLTDAQRETWKLYGQETPVTDALGAQIQLSGQNQFIRSNVPLGQLIESGLTLGNLDAVERFETAPASFNTGPGVLALTEFEVPLDTNPADISFDLAAPAPVDAVALLYVGAPLNAGRTFFKGPYQLAASTDVDATETSGTFAPVWTNPALWQADQIPAEGQRLPVLIRLLYVDGRLSQAFRTIADVTLEVVD